MRVFILITMVCFTGCGDSAAPVVSDDGRYAVTFPGPATTSDGSTTTPLGTMKTTVTLWKHASIDRLHAVTWTDLPVKRDQYDVTKGLDGAVAGLEKESNVKVRDDTASVFGPFKLPSRELRLQHNTRSLWMRSRLVLDTRHMRLYTVVVEGGREYIEGPEADAFFDSFQITK